MGARLFYFLVTGVGCLVPGLTARAAAIDAEPVIIILQASAKVSERPVTFADVTILDGGDVVLRRRIAGLDLNDPLRAGQSTEISARRLLFRLQLANIDPRVFRIQGAERAWVTARQAAPSTGAVTPARYEEPVPSSAPPVNEVKQKSPAGHCVSEEEIVKAAQQLVRRRLPGQPDDISIQLMQPLGGPFAVTGSPEAIRLEAELRSPSAPLGQVRVDVAVLAGGKRQHCIPVNLNVLLYQWVAVALRRIEPGEPLTPDNIRFDRRTVDLDHGHINSPEALVGKKARRVLQASQVVGVADVELINPDNPVLVKARDLVKIVARIGNLKITALGESLQDGRAGQFIRVQNLSSRNVVLGRVIESAIVEVEQ